MVSELSIDYSELKIYKNKCNIPEDIELHAHFLFMETYFN